ncbi:hypothetical protein NL676_026232 [Syzygium grande]|nr:hypothetical protein NL676_026232 [Syzygium grande]
MANPMFLEDGPRGGGTRSPSSLSSSVKDVSYSCGSCGYELNLSSLNRNISTIGNATYGNGYHHASVGKTGSRVEVLSNHIL